MISPVDCILLRQTKTLYDSSGGGGGGGGGGGWSYNSHYELWPELPQ